MLLTCTLLNKKDGKAAAEKSLLLRLQDDPFGDE